MRQKSRLSDNQRRALCRLVFLLVCALPTAAVVYSIVHQPGPVQWERFIQAQLGIKVRIESVETPAPAHTILRGVRFPESALGITTQSSDLVIEEIAIFSSSEGGKISIVHPVAIPTDALTRVVNRCSQHLEHSNLGSFPLQIDFSKISLTDSESRTADLIMQPAGLVIERISGTPEQPESYIQVQLLTRLPAENPENLFKLLFQKTARNQYVKVETNGAVPCRLFEHWQNDLSWLARSRFRGNVEFWINSEHEVDGFVSGDLTGVALDKLAGAYGLPLRGNCNLSAIECRIVDSQIDTARFHVSSNRQGTVGRSFLQSARSLGIRARMEPEADALKYRTLDFDVTIDNGFFTLTGLNSMLAGDETGAAVVSCENDTKMPLHYLATLLTSEKSMGSQYYAFMNRFKIPADRMAASEMDSTPRF